MKLKSKNNLFLVIREDLNGTEIPIAGFLTAESADNYAGECQQTYLDKNITEYVFGIVPVMYYDQWEHNLQSCRASS